MTREPRSVATDDVSLETLKAEDAHDILDELIATYEDVYATSDDEFFGADRYRQQITGHMLAPGWTAVVARIGDEIVGYAYGFPLAENTNWWSGLVSKPAPDFPEETGRRTFAISEIMVRGPWQRQGIAHRLHDRLLAGREEQRATLLVEPGNAPARTAYLKWGWQQVSELRPEWAGAPLYDVWTLPLTTTTACSSATS
jgi:GNAT superfamily N-acetyltransferase